MSSETIRRLHFAYFEGITVKHGIRTVLFTTELELFDALMDLSAEFEEIKGVWSFFRKNLIEENTLVKTLLAQKSLVAKLDTEEECHVGLALDGTPITLTVRRIEYTFDWDKEWWNRWVKDGEIGGPVPVSQTYPELFPAKELQMEEENNRNIRCSTTTVLPFSRPGLVLLILASAVAWSVGVKLTDLFFRYFSV